MDHRPFRVLAIVVAFCVYGVAMFFNAGSGGIFDGELENLFLSNTANISAKYSTEITPAGWTFTIWAFIYTYQFIWLVYGFSTICRRTNQSDKGYLYFSPDYMPVAIYLLFTLNMALNIGWLLLFDREYLIGAVVTLAFIPLTLYACLGLSFWGLKKHGEDLINLGHELEIRFVRGMVHNGLAMYATWTTVATLLNFTIALVYEGDVPDDNASTISLAILAFVILLYVPLDLTVFDKYTRYMVTPHIVLVVALAGTLDGNWNPGSRNFIFTAVLLGLAGVATIIKVIIVAVRGCKNPEPILDGRKVQIYNRGRLQLDSTNHI